MLNGFFDDSGSINASESNFYSLGGYVANSAQWAAFCVAWNDALLEFKVPHLHLRELSKRADAFASWPSGPAGDELEGSFLSRMAAVIVSAGLHGFCTVISLGDLARFNAEKGRSLQPKALALYATLLEVRKSKPFDEMELILDRTQSAPAAIALAKRYAQTDAFHPFMSRFPNIKSLAKDSAGARATPGLQAADYLAWEVRKQSEQNKELLARVSPRQSSYANELVANFLHAKIERLVNSPAIGPIDIPLIPQRRSLTALAEAPTDGFLYDYAVLCDADRLRGGIWQ